MSEEQYAQSRYIKLHRYASIAIVTIAAGIHCTRFGVGCTLRAFAGFVVPLALIWFSDDLAEWAIKDSGGWLNPRNADTFVRIAGWVIILLMMVPRAAILLALR